MFSLKIGFYILHLVLLCVSTLGNEKGASFQVEEHSKKFYNYSRIVVE